MDDAVADVWGRMVAQRKSVGKRIEPIDAFIAATAQIHDLTVVTRDTSAFKASVRALNPWLRPSEIAFYAVYCCGCCSRPRWLRLMRYASDSSLGGLK